MANQDDRTQSLKFPSWQQEYQDALVETTPDLLKQRVLKAEEAIFRRLQALSHSRNADDERQALDDAMRSLRVIQVEKMGYPDWKT
jgi:hypothetical protein